MRSALLYLSTFFPENSFRIVNPAWEEVSHPHADDRKIDNSRSHDGSRLDEHPCRPVDLEGLNNLGIFFHITVMVAPFSIDM